MIASGGVTAILASGGLVAGAGSAHALAREDQQLCVGLAGEMNYWSGKYQDYTAEWFIDVANYGSDSVAAITDQQLIDNAQANYDGAQFAYVSNC